jgi:hypothetical protein
VNWYQAVKLAREVINMHDSDDKLVFETVLDVLKFNL